jgi:1-acyl-sn-glycerol-3-phosphate acyltransferase
MAYRIIRTVLAPVFHTFFRLRFKNRAAVPKVGPAIMTANHQSFCDSLFLPLSTRRQVTFLAKAEYFDDWRSAWFFRALGQIPIRRSGGDASQRALDTAREVLDAGRVIALYPEGTRALDDFVHKGRTGVARLALVSGAPVVPLGLRGTTAVQPVGSRLLRPFRRVEVRFGDPMTISAADVEACGSEREALRIFTDALMAEISRLSGRSYLDEYVPRPDGKKLPS